MSWQDLICVWLHLQDTGLGLIECDLAESVINELGRMVGSVIVVNHGRCAVMSVYSFSPNVAIALQSETCHNNVV